MRIRLDRPTLFQSALVISLIGTILVVAITEAFRMIMQGLDVEVNLLFIVMFIMFIGVAISTILVFWFTERKSLIRYA
jgi:hypothetical protein